MFNARGQSQSSWTGHGSGDAGLQKWLLSSLKQETKSSKDVSLDHRSADLSRTMERSSVVDQGRSAFNQGQGQGYERSLMDRPEPANYSYQPRGSNPPQSHDAMSRESAFHRAADVRPHSTAVAKKPILNTGHGGSYAAEIASGGYHAEGRFTRHSDQNAAGRSWENTRQKQTPDDRHDTGYSDGMGYRHGNNRSGDVDRRHDNIHQGETRHDMMHNVGIHRDLSRYGDTENRRDINSRSSDIENRRDFSRTDDFEKRREFSRADAIEKHRDFSRDDDVEKRRDFSRDDDVEKHRDFDLSGDMGYGRNVTRSAATEPNVIRTLEREDRREVSRFGDLEQGRDIERFGDLGRRRDIDHFDDSERRSDVIRSGNIDHRHDYSLLGDGEHRRNISRSSDTEHHRDTARVGDVDRHRDTARVGDVDRHRDAARVGDVDRHRDTARVGDVDRHRDAARVGDVDHHRDAARVGDVDHHRDINRPDIDIGRRHDVVRSGDLEPHHDFRRPSHVQDHRTVGGAGDISIQLIERSNLDRPTEPANIRRSISTADNRTITSIDDSRDPWKEDSRHEKIQDDQWVKSDDIWEKLERDHQRGKTQSSSKMDEWQEDRTRDVTRDRPVNKKRAEDWEYCRSCDMSFTERKHFIVHCKGVMHTEKMFLQNKHQKQRGKSTKSERSSPESKSRSGGHGMRGQCRDIDQSSSSLRRAGMTESAAAIGRDMRYKEDPQRHGSRPEVSGSGMMSDAWGRGGAGRPGERTRGSIQTHPAPVNMVSKPSGQLRPDTRLHKDQLNDMCKEINEVERRKVHVRQALRHFENEEKIMQKSRPTDKFCKLCDNDAITEDHYMGWGHFVRIFEESLALGPERFGQTYKDIGGYYYRRAGKLQASRYCSLDLVESAGRERDPYQLFCLRSGIHNKFECAVCNLSRHSLDFWMEHVTGKLHIGNCRQLMNDIGLDAFVATHPSIPAPFLMGKHHSLPGFKKLQRFFPSRYDRSAGDEEPKRIDKPDVSRGDRHEQGQRQSRQEGVGDRRREDAAYTFQERERSPVSSGNRGVHKKDQSSSSFDNRRDMYDDRRHDTSGKQQGETFPRHSAPDATRPGRSDADAGRREDIAVDRIQFAQRSHPKGDDDRRNIYSHTSPPLTRTIDLRPKSPDVRFVRNFDDERLGGMDGRSEYRATDDLHNTSSGRERFVVGARPDAIGGDLRVIKVLSDERGDQHRIVSHGERRIVEDEKRGHDDIRIISSRERDGGSSRKVIPRAEPSVERRSVERRSHDPGNRIDERGFGRRDETRETSHVARSLDRENTGEISRRSRSRDGDQSDDSRERSGSRRGWRDERRRSGYRLDDNIRAAGGYSNQIRNEKNDRDNDVSSRNQRTDRGHGDRGHGDRSRSKGGESSHSRSRSTKTDISQGARNKRLNRGNVLQDSKNDERRSQRRISGELSSGKSNPRELKTVRDRKMRDGERVVGRAGHRPQDRNSDNQRLKSRDGDISRRPLSKSRNYVQGEGRSQEDTKGSSRDKQRIDRRTYPRDKVDRSRGVKRPVPNTDKKRPVKRVSGTGDFNPAGRGNLDDNALTSQMSNPSMQQSIFAGALQQFVSSIQQESHRPPQTGAFTPEEEVVVRQIQQRTGISDTHTVVNGLRILSSMNPEVVQSLGRCQPGVIQQMVQDLQQASGPAAVQVQSSVQQLLLALVQGSSNPATAQMGQDDPPRPDHRTLARRMLRTRPPAAKPGFPPPRRFPFQSRASLTSTARSRRTLPVKRTLPVRNNFGVKKRKF